MKKEIKIDIENLIISYDTIVKEDSIESMNLLIQEIHPKSSVVFCNSKENLIDELEAIINDIKNNK